MGTNTPQRTAFFYFKTGEIPEGDYDEMSDENTVETTETAVPVVDAAEIAAELERTRAALKAANRESAERRKRLEELEKQDAERKQAEMTELDRMKAEQAKWQAEKEAVIKLSQETMLKAAFLAEAAMLGLQHPEDAYLLADRSVVEMTDGKAIGVKEAIQALIASGRVPLSKRSAPGLDAGAGSGQSPNDKPKPLSDEELRAARKLGIKPEEYQKYKT